MSPTATIVLITLVLLGAVSAASASRIGGTLPFTLLLPPAAVLSVTFLSHPAGLLVAAALTVLAFTLAFAPRATAVPITSPLVGHFRADRRERPRACERPQPPLVAFVERVVDDVRAKL